MCFEYKYYLELYAIFDLLIYLTDFHALFISNVNCRQFAFYMRYK